MPGYNKAVMLKHAPLTGSASDHWGGGGGSCRAGGGDPLGGWVMPASQVRCSGENTSGVAMDAAVGPRSGEDSARNT